MKIRKFGRRYDTDSAIVFGLFGRFSAWDINCVYEVLYRKRTGEFFLHVRGGANSCYSCEVSSGSFTAGEYIFLISPLNAFLWLLGFDISCFRNGNDDFLLAPTAGDLVSMREPIRKIHLYCDLDDLARELISYYDGHPAALSAIYKACEICHLLCP